MANRAATVGNDDHRIEFDLSDGLRLSGIINLCTGGQYLKDGDPVQVTTDGRGDDQ